MQRNVVENALALIGFRNVFNGNIDQLPHLKSLNKLKILYYIPIWTISAQSASNEIEHVCNVAPGCFTFVTNRAPSAVLYEEAFKRKRIDE
jgi:hypothetical protein